jgi:hypothetical protein
MKEVEKMVKERIDLIIKELKSTKKELTYFQALKKDESCNKPLEEAISIIKDIIHQFDKLYDNSLFEPLSTIHRFGDKPKSFEIREEMEEIIKKGRELGLLESSPWDPR